MHSHAHSAITAINYTCIYTMHMLMHMHTHTLPDVYMHTHTPLFHTHMPLIHAHAHALLQHVNVVVATSFMSQSIFYNACQSKHTVSCFSSELSVHDYSETHLRHISFIFLKNFYITIIACKNTHTQTQTHLRHILFVFTL